MVVIVADFQRGRQSGGSLVSSLVVYPGWMDGGMEGWMFVYIEGGLGYLARIESIGGILLDHMHTYSTWNTG